MTQYCLRFSIFVWIVFLSLTVNIESILCNLVSNEIFQVFALCQSSIFSMKESREKVSISCTLNLSRH